MDGGGEVLGEFFAVEDVVLVLIGIERQIADGLFLTVIDHVAVGVVSNGKLMGAVGERIFHFEDFH